MRLVAAIGRLPAFGENPLDRGHTTEYPVSRMPACAQQQPGDCAGLWGVSAGYKFAHHVTSVGVLPSRTGIVRTNSFALAISEFGFRSFQRPGKFLVCGYLANIDLRAGSVHLQDNLLTRRRFDVVGNFRARNLLSTCQGQNPSCNKQRDGFIHVLDFSIGEHLNTEERSKQRLEYAGKLTTQKNWTCGKGNTK